MRRGWILFLLASAGVALVIGFAADVPSATSGRVLSEQKFPPPATYPVRNAGAPEPKVMAKYALLIDLKSFYPLYRKDAYTPVPVASTTKMMTALVARERFQLDEVVTISRKAASQIGSDTGFVPGEKMTVSNLLKALLIQSGNDAAYALAEHGGSVETFVSWMNEKALELGMRSTSFRDPAGLDDESRSTAFDLAVLAAHFLQDTFLAEIARTPETAIASQDGRKSHLLKSSNRLVTEAMYFPGILGIKTGFTPAAGHTLVAAAERKGHTLISVVLFTFEDTKEASAKESYKLLTWGFENHIWLPAVAPQTLDY